MARHGGGFGNSGGGGTGGAPHVSAAAATAILLLFGAAIWHFMRAPKAACKLFLCAALGMVVMLTFGISSVLESTWMCWGVLIAGWWLADHLRKETDARKARAITQKGRQK